MPVDPIRLLAICREIEQTPHDGLRLLGRETLLATQKVLKALKMEDLRLAFGNEQQLN